jgi:hypothetical protein
VIKVMPKHQLTPTMWLTWVAVYLGVPDVKLAKKLWAKMYPTPQLLWALAQIHDSGGTVKSGHNFLDALPAKDVVDACEKLVKQYGRTLQLRILEEAIMRRLDKDGKWLR